jgi:hypothetical protein
MFQGQIPFPGDLLVGQYAPYSSNIYNGIPAGGVTNKAQGPDVIKELFPWKYNVIEQIKLGHLPFWNPHNFSGNPLLANFQSAVFYPLNIIFLIFSFKIAWTIFIFLIPLLSAFFTYLFMREIRIGKISSIFSGIVFAFCAYTTVWMEYGNIGHTLLWLPLALYLTEKLAKKITIQVCICLICILTFSLLAGYIQGYFYIAVTLLIYYVLSSYTRYKFSIKHILIYSSCLIYPILLGLFQILPTISLLSFSSRGNYSLSVIKNLLNPWWYGITVIAPDFFGNPATRNNWFYGTYIERVSYFGIIPFVFALYALLHIKRDRKFFIFGIIFILSFLSAFDLFVTKFLYLIPIPVISTTVPTRILCVFGFSGVILAGMGLQLFIDRINFKKLFIAIGCVTGLLFIGWLMVFIGPLIFQNQNLITNLSVSKRNLILPTALLISLAISVGLYYYNKKLSHIVVAIILFLTIFDLFRFFQKITPFSLQAYVYPQTPVVRFLQQNASINRYWGYGLGYIETNFQIYDHTFSPDGNDPLHIKTYTEFLESSKNGSIPKSLPRPDANVAGGFGTTDLKENIFRQKVLNILGVKYILAKNDILNNKLIPDYATFDPNIYKLIWQKAPWQIYQNLEAAPRIFLTTDYKVILNKVNILKKFYSKTFNEKKQIILEQDPDIRKSVLKTYNLKLNTYSPNEIIIQTSSDADALLFISDSYYPDWKASIDGKNTKIYVADYTFRAIKVPQGSHLVRFYYDSKSFKIGLVISGFSIILLIGSYFVCKKRSFSGTHPNPLLEREGI